MISSSFTRVQFGAPRSGLGKALVSGVIPYKDFHVQATSIAAAVASIVGAPLGRLAESLDEASTCAVPSLP